MKSRPISILAALGSGAFLWASPLCAAPDWSSALKMDVALSSFKFAPASLHLKAGQAVILHLTNTGSGGHDFTAPAFFRAASIRPGDLNKVKGGSVDVSGHETVDIALIPAAGNYALKCTHMMHSMFGMKGSITVR